ncbi:histidine phosphatase family protein [Acutalibacter intestini]|uniref:histidine phosphatase family protein n=1 Tax=Acutalibacter intestini TaxID=3093659 RepID=UPI002AC8BDDC|nr:histidine phosphatase family protein [Acutalibacter sp. M00204]
MVTKIYLIRHCQSMGNLDRRFQGRFDADVSPEGEKQLALLGLRFRNEPVDVIYTSPLIRAKKTALAIAQYHSQTPVREEPDLIEMDVGQMENLRLEDIPARWPQLAEHWDQAPDLCCFPGGETMEQVYRRASEALDRIIAENPGKTVIAATHGGVLKCLCAQVDFGGIGGLRDCQVFGNTSVSLLLAEEGRMSWQYKNNMDHLPEEMRKPKLLYRFERRGELV